MNLRALEVSNMPNTAKEKRSASHSQVKDSFQRRMLSLGLCTLLASSITKLTTWHFDAISFCQQSDDYDYDGILVQFPRAQSDAFEMFLFSNHHSKSYFNDWHNQ